MFTVPEVLLNILTMINSDSGLVSSACLFSKELLCCFAEKPRPRKHKLSVLRGREEVNKELPPCTAAWMGSKTFPGRRQSGDADKEL